MQITQTSLPEIKIGAGSVGESPQLVTEIGFKCFRGVRVKADKDNQGALLVGGAYVLKAGEAETFPVEDSARLTVAATEADQLYSWWAQ